jgi:hypothetical protein
LESVHTPLRAEMAAKVRAAMIFALAALGVMAIASSASAVVAFSDNFDTDQTANWTFASSIVGDTASNGTGGEANVFFDYSTVGIPPAPGGITTRGMKMQANVPGTAVFSGMSMSPNGVSVGGNFTIQFHMWQNANGPMPGGGAGSTQVSMAGYGSNGTTVQFPGGAVQNSVYFGATGEGGSGVDYRAYLGNGGFTGTAPTLTVAAGSTQPDAQKNPDGSPVFAAGAVSGSTNNSNAYYSTFPGATPPAAQTTLFPAQTGSSAAGTLAFAWRLWEIKKTGTILTYTVDGKLLATINTAMNPAFAFSGSDIFFGQFDINGTTTDATGNPVLFGLVDNVVLDVNNVPEANAWMFGALATIGGLGVCWRRRTAS